MPLGPQFYASVFEKTIDIIDEYFEINFANRYDGTIRTFPRISPGLEQLWKAGSPDFDQRLEATLQTIRHRADVLISPADDGGYFVSVTVYKELEDLPKPVRQTAGAASFRSDTTVERQFEVIDPTVFESNWIPIGRDIPLEQEILQQIKKCMWQRQLHGECRALAHQALDADAAVVLLDDLPANAQAQAAAAVAVLVGLLGRVKRLEDQAAAAPGGCRRRVSAMRISAICVLRVFAHLDAQPAAARHGLAGVDDQVQQDLLDLAAHHGRLGPALELLLDLHAVLAQVLFGQDQHFLHQGDQVGHFAVGGVVAGEAEHAVDDGGGAGCP